MGSQPSGFWLGLAKGEPWQEIGERKATEARVFIPVPWAGDGRQLKVTFLCEAAISMQISFPATTNPR